MSPKIAFAGDIHDDQTYIDNLLHTVEMEPVHHLFLCGDITEPATLEQFSNYDVHLVFGNADHDNIADLCKQAERQDAVVHGDSARWSYTLTNGDVETFVVRHGLEPRDMAYAMAAHNCDYVIHGHYHSEERTEVGSGEVLSFGQGCLLYDTNEGTFEQITYEDES